MQHIKDSVIFSLCDLYTSGSFCHDLPYNFEWQERLSELDQIVAEVKRSEEWEVIRMDLIDIGINRGIGQGELKNIILLAAKKKAKAYSVTETADMLETEVPLVQKIYEALDRYDPKTQWRDIIELIQM